MHMSLFKKGIAEFVGTLVLVFISCGVATLTGGSIVPTALAFGLSIVAMGLMMLLVQFDNWERINEGTF